MRTLSLYGSQLSSAITGGTSGANQFTIEGQTNGYATNTISNGTLRFVAAGNVAAGSLSGVQLGLMAFTNNTGLTIGDKVYTVITNGNPFATATAPRLTVESGGYFNAASGANSGRTINVFSLSGAGVYTNLTTGTTSLNSALTINGTDTSTFSGIIADGSSYTSVFTGAGTVVGTVSLTKAGSGTQILSGTNTYTGPTTVNSGTLQVGVLGGGSTASGSAVSVNGATAVLAGTGTINGATTLTSGTLKPGDSAGDSVGTLNFNSLTYVGGKTEIQISGGLDTSANRDQINVTNALTLSNGSNFNISFSGFTPLSGTSYTWDILDWGSLTQGGFSAGTDGGMGGTNGNFVLPDISGVTGSTWTTSSFLTNGQISIVSNVPEPSRMILLFVGIAALFMRRRRS